jgi:hypothetical protein
LATLAELYQVAETAVQTVNHAHVSRREIMNREIMGQVLDDLFLGDRTEIDEATLGMLFPPGETAGVIDERDAKRSHQIRPRPRLPIFIRRAVVEVYVFKTAGSMARIDRQSLHGLGQGNAWRRRLPNQHRS